VSRNAVITIMDRLLRASDLDEMPRPVNSRHRVFLHNSQLALGFLLQ
jgi:hypothetical protein